MMARDHVEVVAEHEYTAKDRLTDLMNQYEQPLYAYLLVLAGDREVAADCLQETFLRAYQNLARGKPVNGQWLYKVARHRGIDEHNRRHKAQAATDALGGASVGIPGESAQTLAVRAALSRLSVSDREVLYLSRVDGLKAPEIAAMLGIRPGAVRARLHRAHARFRQMYGERS